MAGKASAAHCQLGALETEMSTARIGHRAVRGPVDYRQFNLTILRSACIGSKTWFLWSGEVWDVIEKSENQKKSGTFTFQSQGKIRGSGKVRKNQSFTV